MYAVEFQKESGVITLNLESGSGGCQHWLLWKTWKFNFLRGDLCSLFRRTIFLVKTRTTSTFASSHQYVCNIHPRKCLKEQFSYLPSVSVFFHENKTRGLPTSLPLVSVIQLVNLQPINQSISLKDK